MSDSDTTAKIPVSAPGMGGAPVSARSVSPAPVSAPGAGGDPVSAPPMPAPREDPPPESPDEMTDRARLVSPPFIKEITVRGYRSIGSLENFALGKINVLVGANGSGKSNFVDFFERAAGIAGMIAPLLEDDMQPGGATPINDGSGLGDDSFTCFNGKDPADEIYTSLAGQDISHSVLVPKGGGPGGYIEIDSADIYLKLWLDGGQEPVLKAKKSPVGAGVLRPLREHMDLVAGLRVYRFQNIRGILEASGGVDDGGDPARLAVDGSNIASFLAHMRKASPWNYDRVLASVRQAVPLIREFVIDGDGAPEGGGCLLNWRHIGNDALFHPCQLSEGALRHICLMAAFAQPEPPAAIIIDEPDLGQHPMAILALKLAMRLSSRRTQIIVTTQSPFLVDRIAPEDIIVVDRERGGSVFRRLDVKQIKSYMEDSSLGDLWVSGWFFGGGPYSEI